MVARRILWSILPIALLLSDPAAHAQEIAAVLAGSRGLFWKTVEQGIKQASADHGVSVLLRSTVDDDPETVEQKLQLKMVDYMLQSGAKSLILAPIPVPGITTPIEYPVPVVLIDRPSNQFKALSTVATDNHAAGRVAALSLVRRLAPGAKVGVFRLERSVVSTTARETGFIEAAKELGSEVVIDAYVGHGIREAQFAVEALLRAYQGRLDAVFAPTTEITLAVLLARQDRPRELRPLLVGFEYRPGFEDNLRRGELFAIVMQDPFKMGYTAVEQLLRARAGEKIPEQVMIDVLVVTAETLDDPRVQAALRQPLD
jgi:ribose transport system substrate-binding protein